MSPSALLGSPDRIIGLQEMLFWGLVFSDSFDFSYQIDLYSLSRDVSFI